ncbi:CD1375 family protein [Clostridium sp.]
MIDLYVCLIVNGRRTFAQIPAKFQDAVKQDLQALGLDENGNLIQTTAQ